jgi:hypothetical protein
MRPTNVTTNSLHSDILADDTQINVSLIKINDELTSSVDAADPYRQISVDSANGAMDHSKGHSTAVPWKEFFTNPATLTLIFAGWTNVSTRALML